MLGNFQHQRLLEGLAEVDENPANHRNFIEGWIVHAQRMDSRSTSIQYFKVTEQNQLAKSKPSFKKKAD